MMSSLLHLVDLQTRVYYTLTNLGGGGKAPLPPPSIRQWNRCKTHYYSNQVEECHNDQKSLFKITDTLLVNRHQSKLPTYDDETLLANDFSNFFHAKIETIRANFNCQNLDRHEETLQSLCVTFQNHSKMQSLNHI